MKSEREKKAIETFLNGLQKASSEAGIELALTYDDNIEYVFVKNNGEGKETSISIWGDSISASFRDVIRGLGRWL